jgi:hypothetical protein
MEKGRKGAFDSVGMAGTLTEVARQREDSQLTVRFASVPPTAMADEQALKSRLYQAPTDYIPKR